ncbi:MAG: SPOR domain-containing protein [Aliarcobacter sp.]|nr:SPOR domain-containing protein [Aliarcobacter sp.]
MQIKGEEFIKKVQLQQEREELERKLSELEEVEMTIQEDPVILSRSINNDINNNMEPNDHELNNIMLGGAATNANEENKKKYLILGIVLVVLFLLTIIIIRLLSGGATKEDQFTSNNAESSEMKKLSENSNIEENFQKIINERVKKDSSAPMVPEIAKTTDEKLENLQQNAENNLTGNETIQEEAPAVITNETLDETIKKIEEKKTVQKEKVVQKKEVAKKEVVEKEVVEKKTETKKSVKTLAESPSTDVSKGYFVQIGAFTKKPSDSYINEIRNGGFKYKVYQIEIKGTIYNKVLIGPYSTRGSAGQDVDNIKEKLKVSNAFIVKF